MSFNKYDKFGFGGSTQFRPEIIPNHNKGDGSKSLHAAAATYFKEVENNNQAIGIDKTILDSVPQHYAEGTAKFKMIYFIVTHQVCKKIIYLIISSWQILYSPI